jgi:hypothetical protein
MDGWVDHALTNEQVLFNPGTHLVHEPLVEAVETFWTA